ncbi:hypothetical protein Tmath_2030 [Thermoanaerobacter mathranii subsp. mathranii str. A3]|jgi:copper chaperone|uniref:Uncharacterized protein n=1 Tax=Thermoanaerobacter mathranii subsp. mathranii (strain DSM 11426 / CCUG 53645 / CIP 108742 / A3) TaxID=583358 RepID=A0ABN3Z451_THEM3|nr:hypothetical protein [Thermoanaerobacter thermocopriae]ADH61711.1 hypothetical protein Tmath_2030 [Thermoanaerobacter mathranii subsp. mathranii str. A3]
MGYLSFVDLDKGNITATYDPAKVSVDDMKKQLLIHDMKCNTY